MFTSSVLKRNTSENNKSKSMNKILNDRLYLEMVKFLSNNPINEDSQIQIKRYLSKQVDVLLSEPESISNKQTKQDLINYEKFNPLLQKLIISKLPELNSLLNNLKDSVLNGIDKSIQVLTITKDHELFLYSKIFSLNIGDIIKVLIGQFLIILSAEDSEVENTSVSRCHMLFDNLLSAYFLKEYQKKEKIYRK